MSNELLPDELARFRPFLRVRARQLVLDARLRCRFDESDLVHDAFVRALQDWEQFRGEGEAALVCWLQRILETTYLDAVRRDLAGKRDVRRERALRLVFEESSANLGSFLAAEQSSPSERAARQEQLLRLSEAIDRLPGDQRDAVIMHYLLGTRLRDIAAQLQRSEGTVGYLLFSARKTLKGHLGEGE